MKKLQLFCILLACLTTSGYSLILQVPADYPTIQSAIQAASSGDTVLVAKGTYTEFLNFDGKNIVVASLFLTTGDSLCIDETIIKPPSDGSVVIFNSGETEEARLVGFTIKDGSGTREGMTWYGGGIYCDNSHPTLEHLKVTGNVAGGFGGCGGGIYFRESHALVLNCRIEQNEGGKGGGIRCDGANITVRNTWFKNNFAVSSGGGIMFVESPSPRIEQCTFTGNSGIYGGAITCNYSHPVIDRVTSFHNHGGYGGTLNAEGNSNPKVVNSIFWNNSMDPGINNEIFLGPGYNTVLVAYCDILGSDTAIHNAGTGTVHWMEGNIELYPEFNDTTLLDLSLPKSSPCVDAGIPLFLHNGDTLVVITNYSGIAPDMGANEYLIPVSSDPLPFPGSIIDLRIMTGNNTDEKMICFTLPETLQVQSALYDMQGRTVSRSPLQTLPSGDYSWPLSTATLHTGIYMVRLIAGGHTVVKKILVD